KKIQEYKLNSSSSLVREYRNINYGEAKDTLELNYILNNHNINNNGVREESKTIKYIDFGVKTIPSINLTYSMKSLGNLLESYAKSQYDIFIAYTNDDGL